MLRNHETLESWVSDILGRKACLQLLSRPQVNTNGSFFSVSFAQDLKSVVRDQDGLISHKCTCQSSQAAQRQGKWPKGWMLWSMSSSSHPLGCHLLMPHRALPKESSSSGKGRLTQGYTLSQGQPIVKASGYRDTKVWPRTSIWTSLKDHPRLRAPCGLTNYNTVQHHPVFLSPLQTFL